MMRWLVRGALAVALVVASLWWMQLGPFDPAAAARRAAPLPRMSAEGAAAFVPEGPPARGAGSEAGEGSALLPEEPLARLAALDTVHTRTEVPAADRVAQLLAALEAEVAQPTDFVLQGSFLPGTASLKSRLMMALARMVPHERAALRRALAAQRGEAREWLVLALGYAGEREQAAEVRALLRSEGPERRMLAADLLGAWGDETSVPALEPLLEDPFSVEVKGLYGPRTLWPVRAAAYGALKALGRRYRLLPSGQYARVGEGAR